MDNRRAFGEIIRKLRDPRSQKELAAKVGISKSVWSLWESGKRYPRPHNIKRIADAMGMTYEELGAMVSRYRPGHSLPERAARSNVFDSALSELTIEVLSRVVDRLFGFRDQQRLMHA